jgi:hypothetical protein
MNSNYLNRIILRFPAADRGFIERFIPLIGVLGKREGKVLELNCSSQNFYPKISLDFSTLQAPGVVVDFILSDGEAISVRVENTTGEHRQSPHAYSHLKIDQVIERLARTGIRLAGVDHVGFNLPWFATRLHPEMVRLRERLASKCLYHIFPTGEPWDFIIPGDQDEIMRRKDVDYSQVRRPKFEIVSFDKASTPLIQLDLQFDASYERLLGLFPEALNDPEIRNLWIYLENPSGVDICLVANELDEHDWGGFFEGSRK